MAGYNLLKKLEANPHYTLSRRQQAELDAYKAQERATQRAAREAATASTGRRRRRVSVKTQEVRADSANMEVPSIGKPEDETTQ